jgi:hypothetical protein
MPLREITEQELSAGNQADQIAAPVLQQTAAPKNADEQLLQAGSPAALKAAVDGSKLPPPDSLVEAASFYLGKNSAKKFQKYVEGNYEPMADEDFTDQERQFLVNFENKRGRKVLGGAIRYGGPLALMAVPGAQTLGGEMIANVALEGLAQLAEPEKMRPYQIAAEALPTFGIAKEGTGKGLKKALTSETGVGQQASIKAQALKEVGYGGARSGAQAGIEAQGEDVTGGEIALRTLTGGLLFPGLSGVVRGVGAAKRSGFNFPAFVGEFNRPFVQKALSERADSIRKELGNEAGIDPALARQVADAVYTPSFSGSSQEQFDQFADNVYSFLTQSVVQGRASGLSGNDLTQAIVGELKRVSGNAEINPAVIESVLRQSDFLIEKATQKVDSLLSKRSERAAAGAARKKKEIAGEVEALKSEKTSLEQQMADAEQKSQDILEERNSRAVAFARRAENRLQLESEDLVGEIRALNKQKSELAASDVANRTRIEAQIFRNQEEIKAIENGFDERFAASKPVGSFEAGSVIGENWNKIVDELDARSKKGFDKIRPDLKKATIEVDLGRKDKNGDTVLETKNLEDLRLIRSQIYRQFNFNAQVQQGTFESWRELNYINDQITAAFEKYPPLKAALEQENKLHSEAMRRVKGSFANKILRDIGEGGGKPESIAAIIGPQGSTTLEILKEAFAEKWETEAKPILKDFIYNQIRGEKPTDFLNALTQAKSGKNKGISRNVVEEFFPAFGEIQDVAAKYGSLIDEGSKLEKQFTDLTKESESLAKDVEKNVTGAEDLLKENSEKKKEIKKRLFQFQKKNEDFELKGVLAEPSQQAAELRGKIAETGKEISQKEKEGAGVTKRLAEFQKSERPLTGVLAKPKEFRDLLISIKAKVDSGAKLDNEEVAQIISNPDAKSMLQDLNDYVTESAKKVSEFEKLANRTVKTGRFDDVNVPPGEIIDFLKSSSGDIPSRIRTKEFVAAIKSSRPELQADLQNILLGRIVNESLVQGKKSIDTNKMKSLIAGGDSPGEYNAIVSQLFGDGGVEKISTIADQLAKVMDNKDSLVKKSIVPALATLATGGAYLSSGPGAALGTGLLGFVGRKLVISSVGQATLAGVGKLLQSPTYGKTVSTPIDQLTQDQIDLFNRNWSRLLKLETDKAMMQSEERQIEEKQMREAQRQTRRRD